MIRQSSGAAQATNEATAQTGASRWALWYRYPAALVWFAWAHRGGRPCGPDCRCDEN